MADSDTTPQTAYPALSTPEAITEGLGEVGYIASEDISTLVFLADRLRKPILIEGPAGVGKTDLAVSLGRWLEVPVTRLQCYEGLDEGKALYEWQYGKQLLYTQLLRERLDAILGDAGDMNAITGRLKDFDDIFFSPDFLAPRPLLKAMQQPGPSVLLIDEIDKSDEEFEAFLLEVLSDYQVTVPEIGTIRANVAPLVLLTSNNVRELSDALKRRCLHLHIGFPDAARERRIVAARVPGIGEDLLKQLVDFVQSLREADIKKRPSIAETVDWAKTLLLMHADMLDEAMVRRTLNVLLKHESDIAAVDRGLAKMARDARDTAGQAGAGTGRTQGGYPDLS
ncbi:MAG: MoxR family ATPase [Pseudomonadota bacterium]